MLIGVQQARRITPVDLPSSPPRNSSYDCGNPKDGYLKLGVWKGFPKAWPKAYKLLQKMSFSNLDIAVMAKLVDVDKMEADAAAAKWMKENEKKWKPWVAAAKM